MKLFGKNPGAFDSMKYGWGICPDPSPSYTYYRYRENGWNWGNIIISPDKKGRYAVTIEIVRNKKRFKKKVPVKNFREGLKVAQLAVKRFHWGNKKTKPYPSTGEKRKVVT